MLVLQRNNKNNFFFFNFNRRMTHRFRFPVSPPFSSSTEAPSLSNDVPSQFRRHSSSETNSKLLKQFLNNKINLR